MSTACRAATAPAVCCSTTSCSVARSTNVPAIIRTLGKPSSREIRQIYCAANGKTPTAVITLAIYYLAGGDYIFVSVRSFVCPWTGLRETFSGDFSAIFSARWVLRTNRRAIAVMFVCLSVCRVCIVIIRCTLTRI